MSDGMPNSNIEEILPSFEMHNYMFNRSIFDTHTNTENENGPTPPGYQEAFTNAQNLPNLNSNTNSFNLNFGADASNNSNSNSNSNLNNLDYVDPTANPNALLLNNLDIIKKLNIPIRIQIVLTRSPAKFGQFNERENPVRSYKPGEMMYGYIIIENKSSQPIPFEMLMVSLEAEYSVHNPSKISDTEKVQKFLRAFDLSACYHEGNICLETQGTILHALQKDEIDDSHIGFTPDRVIEPGIKHKKFFMFKVPTFLLDTTCNYQFPEHLCTPPSFGLDKRSFDGRANAITINPFLGYGRLDEYGSPIKTNDYAIDGQAVSYYLKVQVIGNYAGYVKTLSPKSDLKDNEFVVLKEKQFYFRVDTSFIDIPNAPPPDIDDEYKSSFPRISTIEQLKYLENMVVTELDNLSERKDLLALGIIDRRQQDEIINRNISNAKKISQTQSTLVPMVSPTASSSKISTLKKLSLSDSNCNSNESLNLNHFSDSRSYAHVSQFTFTKDLFSKIDGTLKVTTSLEKNSFMKSISPKSLKAVASSRANNTENKKSMPMLKNNYSTSTTIPLVAMRSSEQQLKQSFSETNLLNNSSSNDKIGQFSGFIYISLEFKTRQKHSNSQLPHYITITPNLVAYNIQSGASIPITFDDKFIHEGGLNPNKIANLSKKFGLYKNQLLSMSKDIKVGVQRNVLEIANGISKLQSDKNIVKKLFKSETIDLSNQWKRGIDGDTFIAEFKFPLKVDEKGSLRHQNSCVIPSFQSCHLSRLYSIECDVSLKKGKPSSDKIIEFPFTVA